MTGIPSAKPEAEQNPDYDESSLGPVHCRDRSSNVGRLGQPALDDAPFSCIDQHHAADSRLAEGPPCGPGGHGKVST